MNPHPSMYKKRDLILKTSFSFKTIFICFLKSLLFSCSTFQFMLFTQLLLSKTPLVQGQILICSLGCILLSISAHFSFYSCLKFRGEGWLLFVSYCWAIFVCCNNFFFHNAKLWLVWSLNYTWWIVYGQIGWAQHISLRNRHIEWTST